MTEFSIRFDKDKAMRDGLRAPFPPELIVKLPRGGILVDALNHAAVVDRLNTYAPGWEVGKPEMFTHGGTCWVLCSMTVGGITRWEYGEGKTPKEAMSDVIKRGAMRFGVGLDLWSKEELIGYAESEGPPSTAATVDGDGIDGPGPDGGEGPSSPVDAGVSGDGDDGPATPQQWDRLLALPDVGGSATKARNRINRYNSQSYTKETVINATVAEVARAITGG